MNQVSRISATAAIGPAGVGRRISGFGPQADRVRSVDIRPRDRRFPSDDHMLAAGGEHNAPNERSRLLEKLILQMVGLDSSTVGNHIDTYL